MCSTKSKSFAMILFVNMIRYIHVGIPPKPLCTPWFVLFVARVALSHVLLLSHLPFVSQFRSRRIRACVVSFAFAAFCFSFSHFSWDLRVDTQQISVLCLADGTSLPYTFWVTFANRFRESHPGASVADDDCLNVSFYSEPNDPATARIRFTFF